MKLAHSFLARKEFSALFIAIVLSLVLIFSNQGKQIQTLRSWTFGGLGFALEGLTALGRYEGVFEENRWLRKQNANLMLENSSLKETQSENKRLRQLLGFKNKSPDTLIPAKIIGRDEGGFINSIVVNAGSDEGLRKKMAVVTAQGLVGKIFSIGRENATAQLLLDHNFRVSAIVQRSRVTGIVEWQGRNKVMLAAVPKRSDIQIGDKIVTSGLSTVFPGGLEVGVVTQTTDKQPGMFMKIWIHPSVDFSKLEEVFIVKMAEGSVTVN